MASLYWFVRQLDASVNALPSFLARPGKAAIDSVYFRWRPLLVLGLPTLIAGVLGPALAYDLPPQESIPALLLIVGLLFIAYVQWGQVEHLRGRVHDLETELEEASEYERP